MTMPADGSIRRRVAVLQHVPFEGPGAIGEWAEARGHDLVRVHLHRGEVLMAACEVDAVVVMGGPMGVADEAQFPFLREEKHFVHECLAEGIPVLGVCLGAQILAEVLGAQVRPQGYREIGWFPVRWEPRARSVPGFEGVPEESVVFHWHGDTFSQPSGTVPLGRSTGCAAQGFATPDGRAIGLQFHLEMRAIDVRHLLEHGRHEMEAGGTFVQREEELLAGHERHGTALRGLLEDILDRWAAHATRAETGTAIRRRPYPELAVGTRLRRDPALVPLSHDHHHALVQSARLRDAAAGEPGPALEVGRAFIHHWHRAMIGHFEDEEQVLFPAVRAARGEDVARLLEEHAEIAGLVVELESTLAGGSDVRELLLRIGWLVHDHVRFEERVHFEAAQGALGPAGLAAVGLALQERRSRRGVTPPRAPEHRQ